MTGLGNTVSNSEPQVLQPFRAPSARLLTRHLRGVFKYPSAGRNSCGSIPTTRPGIEIFETPGGGVSVAGEHHCNSISSCPSCRKRILSRRASEIQGLIDLFLAGLDVGTGQKFSREVLFLTLTFSHNRFDTLDSLLGSTRFNEGMRGARSYLFGQSGFYQFAKKWLLGNVNGIEVTHGQNGFHPHLHCLLFVEAHKMPGYLLNPDGTVNLPLLESIIYKYWAHSCEKAELSAPSAERGCTLKSGATAAWYVSKFTAGQEVSDSGNKSAKSERSNSIADLERMAFNRSLGASERGILQTYYQSMYGVRVHNFSKNLRYFRRIYNNTRFAAGVHKSLGVGFKKTGYFLNDAGPGYLESLPVAVHAGCLPDVLPDDFQVTNKKWVVAGSEPCKDQDISLSHADYWDYCNEFFEVVAVHEYFPEPG